MGGASIYKVTARDKTWPKLLSELPEKAAPKQLYVRGTLPPDDTLVVSVVGTRHPTPYGKDMAEEIVGTLARHKICIASGMAIGIDTIAHKTALQEGTHTIAVLGSGLKDDVIYPKENLELLHEIETNGAVISEYKEDQKPELWTFPQRNRIIAGIARATIIIEAGEKSGALITARFATEYGRDVLALPGPVTSSQSRGTNNLLKHGAIPITDPDVILEILGIVTTPLEQSAKASTPEEATILSLLDTELTIDEIIKESRLQSHIVLAATTDLEMRGVIKGIGGGIYRKK